jgi:hypothetical protein
MPDYKLGKIYKLESLSTGLVYIGSTCQLLNMRMCGHRTDLKKFNNGKPNCMTSFKVLEQEDCKIYLLEDYPCDRKEQLHAREAEWIKKMDCVNKVIPGRTPKEYYIDNKDKISAHQKNYRQVNKDKINAQREIYNKETNYCDCGGRYTLYHKSEHCKTLRHQKYIELKDQM